MAQRAKAELGASKLELQTTGRVSDTAKKELAARGFAVLEKQPNTFEVRAAAAAKAPAAAPAPPKK